MKNFIFLACVVLLSCGPAALRAATADSRARAAVYLTAKDTSQRLARIGELEFVDLPQPTEEQAAVFVDPSKSFQSLLGIGGALTDAAAETFDKLPKAAQKEFLAACFDPQSGIGYSLGRTHINSCDFSSESYSYVKEGDADLASFNIAHDLRFRVPFIKEVLATAGKDFTLFASPWSPCAWMKSNHDMLRGGKLLPDCADAWARYYVKFIRAYEQQGIPVWGVTVQNEPMAKQIWESCLYTAEEERDFVKHHLGPVLHQAGLADKKVIIWDHNRNLIYQRAKVVLDDPLASKYVWGVGFHWYVGDHFENLACVEQAYPGIHLLFTEGCHGPYNAARFDDWKWGEIYARSMIADFNNGAVGWTDWNVLLDERGGPNHVGNFCFAPIHGNTKTGKLSYMNSFYYIGHFSKFIRPRARRIISSSTLDTLQTTAFKNEDGQIAVVVMNMSNRPQAFFLWLNGKAAKANSRAHSIMTLVIPQPDAR